MAGITTYLSILTLNFSGLNSAIKRHWLANWINKENLTISFFLFTRNLPYRHKHWLRVKGWEKIYQANGPWKQVRVGVLVSDKVDFKVKLVKRDKEAHFILIKRTIYQKEIKTVNLHVPNVGAPKFIKYILLDLKNTNRPQHSSGGRLQYLFITNR
jgi:hypothetical protein